MVARSARPKTDRFEKISAGYLGAPLWGIRWNERQIARAQEIGTVWHTLDFYWMFLKEIFAVPLRYPIEKLHMYHKISASLTTTFLLIQLDSIIFFDQVEPFVSYDLHCFMITPHRKQFNAKNTTTFLLRVAVRVAPISWIPLVFLPEHTAFWRSHSGDWSCNLSIPASPLPLLTFARNAQYVQGFF